MVEGEGNAVGGLIKNGVKKYKSAVINLTLAILTLSLLTFQPCFKERNDLIQSKMMKLVMYLALD